jgi:hypothetical protein
MQHSMLVRRRCGIGQAEIASILDLSTRSEEQTAARLQFFRGTRFRNRLNPV